MNALTLNVEVSSNKKESWSIGTIEPVLSDLLAGGGTAWLPAGWAVAAVQLFQH